MRRYILFISFLFLGCGISLGQKDILNYAGGTISTAVVWNAYDIIYINGNITISTGGSLTILPNTTGPNAPAGLPVYVACTGSYSIMTTSGVLTVGGTSSRIIYFTADWDKDESYGESGETWKALAFISGNTSTSDINNSVVELGTGYSGSGGGIYINSSKNITVRNTTVRNCTTGRGGGIYCNPSSSGGVTLQNLSIHHNTATTYEGGGLSLSGSSTTVVDNLTVYNNDAPAGYPSDGIYLNTALTIRNSSIYNNSGIGVHISTANAALSNCILYGNTTGVNFTAAGNIINCIVYGNTTGVNFTAAGNIINCDIVNNTTGAAASTYSSVLFNTVLWGNSTEYTGSALTLAYCGIEGGLTGGIDGGGNVNLSSTNGADTGPNFVNPLSPDLHINSGIAPQVDGGSATYSSLTAPTTDMEGHVRIGTTDMGAYEKLYYLWTGNNNSTDWTNTGNWAGSPSSVPTTITDNKVVIPEVISLPYPTVSSLTLETRSSLTIRPRAGMTVTGATIVNTGCIFLLESNSSGSANFISGSSLTGSFNVQMYLTGGPGSGSVPWHYVTTPVNGIGKAVLTTDIGNTNNLLNYDESDVSSDRNQGWNWHDGYGSTTIFSNLYNTQGYCVYAGTNPQTALFTGMIANSSDFTLSNLSSGGTVNDNVFGWHLIGNPFTTFVDAVEQYFSLGADLSRTLYFIQNNNTLTYNVFTQEGTGATNLIPPLQAFFVHVINPGGSGRSVTIPASSRLYSQSSLYKGSGNKSNPENSILKFNITDGSSFTDEALVYFFKDATTGLDGNYDAYKLLSINQAYPQIYTLSGDKQLAMNGLPYPLSKTVVPLNIRLGEAKEYTINILKLLNLNDYNVTLIHGDKKTDLRTNPVYSFYATAGTITDMSLVFENITTDIIVPSEEPVLCWYSNGSMKIKTGLTGFEKNSSVRIFDINGRIIYNNRNVSIVNNQIIELPVNLIRGVYVTEVTNNGLRFIRKTVVTY